MINWFGCSTGMVDAPSAHGDGRGVGCRFSLGSCYSAVLLARDFCPAVYFVLFCFRPGGEVCRGPDVLSICVQLVGVPEASLSRAMCVCVCGGVIVEFSVRFLLT
jgi:hypothetical protein